MAIIKCPHCGAGNRDNAETRQCWQCEHDLWEPVERGTYALGSLPPMDGTTALTPGTAAVGAPQPIQRWKLTIAAMTAALTLLLLVAAVVVFLDSRPRQELPTQHPAAPIPK